MTNVANNPFPADPDRREIWDILMRRDFEAFIAADWSLTAPDFLESEFSAIDAHRVFDPAQWTLRYPRLEDYRSEWLKQAAEFRPVELVGMNKLEFLFSAAKLERIDITHGRAMAHKKFDGEAMTTSGSELRLKWYSLYLLRQVRDRWKITGFVGYLPNIPGQLSESP